MTKSSAYTTLKLIADILSFDDNQKSLSKQIEASQINWDDLVIIGSKHLVLPAIYCQLNVKGLLSQIPEDLNLYLEEITAVNRNRNKVLLEESIEITELFQKEKIDHVFIKGIALIAGHTFADIGERMVGDIDILVASHQLQNAYEILTKYGYKDTISFNYEQENYRHLPRQVSRQKIGAIELHGEVLISKYKHLINVEQLLKNKDLSHSIPIPTNEDSIWIAILGLQINDRAHLKGFLKLKTIYDCLALKLLEDKNLIKKISYEKHGQSFLHISNVFVEKLTPYNSSFYSKLLKNYFLFSLQHPNLGDITYNFLNTTYNIIYRLKLMVSNKSYRRHIFKNKLFTRKKK